MIALHAHRGASHAAPENTWRAFERAIAEGADAIELDVRLTADEVAVVFHDDDLTRMTGAPGRMSTTPSSALSHLRAGGEPIPFMRELVDLAAPAFNIELKPTPRPRALVDAALPTLVALRCPVLVSSFDPRVLAMLHAALPQLPLAYIYEDARALTALKLLPPVDLHPRCDLVTADTLPTILPAECPARALRAWTVDDPIEARRLLALPHPHDPERPAVAALITNRPGPLRAELAAFAVPGTA